MKYAYRVVDPASGSCLALGSSLILGETLNFKFRASDLKITAELSERSSHRPEAGDLWIQVATPPVVVRATYNGKHARGRNSRAVCFGQGSYGEPLGLEVLS